MRFWGVHRQFGLKFWALVSGGGALPGPLEQFLECAGLRARSGLRNDRDDRAIISLNHPFHVAEGTIGKPLAGAR